MKRVVILHGTEGSPGGNWFRWLEGKLRAKGLEVWLPQLPHAEQPSLREWLNFVTTNCPFSLDEETAVIGHSSGATLSLALASESKARLGAIVAVSPFVPTQETYAGTAWEANARLFDVEFDWDSIKANAVKRLIVCSDNDPYIPTDVFRHIATQAGAEEVLISGQGHFNSEISSQYTEFPLLFSLLMEHGIVSHGLIQIVDENDVPIRGGTMQEAQDKGLWHRIVRVMVEDDQGNVLIQKRGPIMFTAPNRWDNSSSGHVDVDEDWLEAAKRELAEEIGLVDVELTEWQRYKQETKETDGRSLRRFNVVYRTVVPHDTVFTLQPEEISEVRWFSREELRRLVTENPDAVTYGLRKITEDCYEDN